MVEVIPAILEKEFSEVRAKIHRIEQEAPSARWVQLDVMDGKFVPNVTWNNPVEFSTLTTNLSFELHLMVENPRKEIERWSTCPPIKRFFFHREAVTEEEMVKLLVLIKEKRREGGIVLNPKTSLETIRDHMAILDGVMFMGVNPGFSGQQLIGGVLNKIKALHGLYPSVPIAVDGGVNEKTAPRLISSGAARLCVASYLWKSGDAERAIEKLLH